MRGIKRLMVSRNRMRDIAILDPQIHQLQTRRPLAVEQGRGSCWAWGKK